MKKNSLVLYKTNAAVVTEIEGDKFIIRYCSVPATPTGKKAVYSEQKVREKDVVLLHEGPVSSLENVLSFSYPDTASKIQEAYELFASDEDFSQAYSLLDICDIAFGNWNADSVWCVFSYLQTCPLFALSQEEFKNGKISFLLRTREQIDLINQKEYEKNHEAELHNAFIQRLKDKKLNLPDDARFMGEVEAFALCKTDKCKVLQEIGFSIADKDKAVIKAHQLLIDTGIWNFTKNPYPTRYGFSFDSAKDALGAMPEEERITVPGFAYAIDGEHSTDPDDAVGFDGKYLWVHIADPASSVAPDSVIDIAARNRGTTLYIPEGASRMLCESCLEDYALGLKENSSALSFRLLLDENAGIQECKVFRTHVDVKRMTYAQAELQKESPELKPLFEIARKNLKKRLDNGAVSIQMPEVHISVDKETKKVSVEPEERYESNDMIQEMMLLAGEGAARFAFENQIPFPYVSQEAPEFPDNLPDGWAGQFARVKCMRKRSVGITPSPHAGVGLSFYSQVTSPLRRYGDLVSHQQLRAFIKGERLIEKDDMLMRISAGDAASLAAKKASRLSETHWKLVYLLQNPELSYEGFCIDTRGKDALFLIPSLDMQTSILNTEDFKLNDSVHLKMTSVNIPEQKVVFKLEK